jgi:hypothetical protein
LISAAPRARRPAGLAVTVLVLALLAALAILASPAPAQADTMPGRVTLTTFSPATPTPASRLTISGRVANTNTIYDLTDVSVRVTISAGPLPNRAAIDAIANGSNVYDGFAISQTTEPVAQTIKPGKERDFSIRVRMRDLPLTGAGVYVIGVEMIGIDPRLGFTVLGVGRTLLPWIPDDIPEPLDLAWLWPLATWPGRTADGVLLGESTPRAISDGGRLDQLLTAGTGARREVSWIIDPELTETVESMTSGYLVANDGELLPGTAEQAAEAWSKEMRSVADRTEFFTLPYADLDAEAFQRAGLEADVIRAVAVAGPTARASTGSPGSGTVFWAPGGRVSEPNTRLLASAGVSAVILRDDALRPILDPGLTPTGIIDLDTQFGPLRAVLIDSGLRAALSMPESTRAERMQARQRFLAETAAIALEDPTIARTVIAGPGNPRWRGDERLLRELLAAVRVAPWVDFVTLGDVLDAPASTIPRSRAPYGPRERENELTREYVDAIVRAQDSLALVRQVVANPVDITEPIAGALLRSGSTAWRGRPATGVELLDSIQSDLDADIARVSVVSRGTVTFSGDTGRIPITVANDFDRPVTVGLRVEGSPIARLQAEPLEPLQIEAGRRASLEVPVRIIGGEPLPVTVHLITDEGADFGASTTLRLQTTAYSRAALWVSVGAAVLLVLLVIGDIARRARMRRSADPNAADDPVEGPAT